MKDKITGFEFKDGELKQKEKSKPPVMIKGMQLDNEEEDGWEDDRGNFIINPKEGK